MKRNINWIGKKTVLYDGIEEEGDIYSNLWKLFDKIQVIIDKFFKRRQRHGKKLRNEFINAIIIFSIFSLIGLVFHLLCIFEKIYYFFTFQDILIGFLIGVLTGLYTSIRLYKGIQGNIYFYRPLPFSIKILMGISLILYFFIPTEFSKHLSIIVFIGVWLSILIPFIWLLNYEKKNGIVFINEVKERP